MIIASRERGDQTAVDFWSYVLRVVELFKHDGMSDEEDAAVQTTTNGVTRVEQVKKIPILSWRHPWFRDLFKIVDSATGVERVLFYRAGTGKLARIRVDTVRHRNPPVGLPQSFFDRNYLNTLLEIDWEDLAISEVDIPVYNFIGFNPNAPQTT